MSDDLMARARRALGDVEPPARDLVESGARFDPVKGAGLLGLAQVTVGSAPKTEVLVSPAPPRQLALTGKLVVSIDATSSRSDEWGDAKALHDRTLTVLPRQCGIALAVYHCALDTFTPFMWNRRGLRSLAAGIDCTGWKECVPEVLAHVVKIRDDVAAVINITDASADCGPVAREYAETLRARRTRIFVMLDASYGGTANAPAIFASIAARTGGAVLPFSSSGLQTLLQHLNGSIGCRHEL